ncbi:MAG: class I SAM-dependent methyltransferase [Candidatus ainarchaeum sp.]|nr:class I SAM-dependent methyltransferase [Candidatus ainarchaeum sp.]
MNNEKKEKLVQKLYEKYPYPNRGKKNREELLKYGKWVSNIFGEKTDFWSGKKVLELGCGTGELANSLAIFGAKIKAIDFSENSIREAKKLSKKIGNQETVFLKKNILEIEFEEKFDVVIALGSLHHTINARKGFDIAYKHCKKNGLIIIGLYNKYSRFRHRVKRVILFLFAGNDFEKRISLGKKIFGGKNIYWCADKYGQVHESYHSVSEVLKWFKKNKIEFVASKPKFVSPIIDELKWLLRKENAFFVMIGRKI